MISDNVLQALSLILTTITTITLAVLAYFTAVATTNSKKIVQVVEKAKTTLEDNTKQQNEKLNLLVKTTEATQKVSKTTHALVNSNMGIQLELNATLARRLAKSTHSQSDAKIADAAEAKYKEHMSTQTIIDNKS